MILALQNKWVSYATSLSTYESIHLFINDRHVLSNFKLKCLKLNDFSLDILNLFIFSKKKVDGNARQNSKPQKNNFKVNE